MIELFQNRKLLIATKHSKEVVIAPLFEKELQVECLQMNDFDTDLFGTFTGEIERLKSSYETVKLKCLTALRKYNYDLGIASEGSFTSHPIAGFLPINEEFLLFIDLKNNIEVLVKEVSIDTNFSSTYVSSWNELLDFANKIGFPEHTLILRPSSESKSDIIKDIVLEEQLKTALEHLLKKYQKVFVETDMRAINNPKRMNVIESAAKKLVEKVKTVCPNCNTPGFGVENVELGLPCKWCYEPTNSIKLYIKKCNCCNYSEKTENSMKKFEDPMYCDKCNP